LEQAEKSRMLYQNVPLRTQVVPSKGFDGVYFAILDGLQYLYGRNYIKRQNVIQMGLSGFPLCLSIQESNVIVSVGENLEVIDPVSEERSVIKTHLWNPITTLACPKKTNQAYAFCSEGLAIY
jgi:WD repeat-containing protein 90